jgi:uncharacterized protein YjiS (DUF1127 family)
MSSCTPDRQGAARRKETIMSEISKAMASRRSDAGGFLVGIGQALKRCWLAYMDWRLQQLAIGRLRRMSSRELRDIGLIRSQIEREVRGSSQHPMPGWRFF